MVAWAQVHGATLILPMWKARLLGNCFLASLWLTFNTLIPNSQQISYKIWMISRRVDPYTKCMWLLSKATLIPSSYTQYWLVWMIKCLYKRWGWTHPLYFLFLMDRKGCLRHYDCFEAICSHPSIFTDLAGSVFKYLCITHTHAHMFWFWFSWNQIYLITYGTTCMYIYK